ncbi:MAG: sugar phosphate isomerase/epimerase [Chloroflexi bacterium]|nr:sugar phosphate isomerase/epimerase [Chloroflexota bacterium]
MLAEACASLSTDTLTLCTGTRDPDDMWRGRHANREPAVWAHLLVSMEKAIAIADEFDVMLGIEPETANVVDSAQKAQYLLDDLRSARLKIILDPANLFGPDNLCCQDSVLANAFDLLAPDMIMGHARDLILEHGEVHHAAAGSVMLDYPRYLSLLRSNATTHRGICALSRSGQSCAARHAGSRAPTRSACCDATQSSRKKDRLPLPARGPSRVSTENC